MQLTVCPFVRPDICADLNRVSRRTLVVLAAVQVQNKPAIQVITNPSQSTLQVRMFRLLRSYHVHQLWLF
jgi:hypothetical protein